MKDDEPDVPEPLSEPYPPAYLRLVLVLVAVAFLADASEKVTSTALALVSPLTPPPGRAVADALLFGSLTWLGAAGLLFRRNWGRALLLVMVGVRALQAGAPLVRLLAGGAADPLGRAMAAGVLGLFGAILLALYGGEAWTPSPPPPLTGARVAAALAVTALTVGVVLLDHALP